jgi:hypothetical protein
MKIAAHWPTGDSCLADNVLQGKGLPQLDLAIKLRI